MNYQVKEYYYDVKAQIWEFVQDIIETTDLDFAKKIFFQASWKKTTTIAVWEKVTLVGIDELGVVTTMIELKKRSNI